MKTDYEKLSIPDRLYHCERAIGLLIHQMAEKKEAISVQRKRSRAEAVKCWKNGEIASALNHDAQARGAEIAERSISEVQHRFSCWQGYSDTPDAELQFPVYPENAERIRGDADA